MRLALPLVLIGLHLACTPPPPQAPPEPECDITLDTIDGKAFVMLEVMGDKSEVPNPRARLKFVKKDGAVHALYTVKSLDRVYDYTCEKNSDKEFRCTGDPNLEAMCVALEVNEEGSCTKDAIRGLGVKATDEDLDKAIKKAKDAYAAGKKSDQFPQFKAMYNNVGNALMGTLYAKIDARRCRLTIDDMFMTVYNGKKLEDFNPVGTNAFVKTSEEWLWDDCDTPNVLAGWKDENLPSNLNEIPPIGEFAKGADTHFFYVGDKDAKATEGCTYSHDLYVNWKPVTTGGAIEVKDDKVDWHITTKLDEAPITFAPGKKGSVVHMTRTKTCGGKAERIDTVCAGAVLK